METQKKKPTQPKTETQKEKAKVKELKRVEKAVYDKYTSLKFLSLTETKLTDEALKELADLEKEIKSCAGPKSIRTVRAAIDNEQALLVSGVPVPVEIEKLIKDKGEYTTKYYFG